MVVKSLANLQWIWATVLKLIVKSEMNELLINLHAKELGDVIMWNTAVLVILIKDIKRTQIMLFPQKIYKTTTKTWKLDYNTSLTHT